MRKSLLRSIHKPNLPSPLRLLVVPLVNENAEGEEAEGKLHEDAGKSDELAGLFLIF